MKYKLLLCLIGICASPLAQSQVLFEETSEAVNFNFMNAVEFGSGVSFCDFDNDGWDDITTPSDEGDTIGFYKNVSGVFEEVTFNFDEEVAAIKQVVWIDFDNDGDKDLFVASEAGKNKLFRNDDFVFIDVTITSGLPDSKLQTNSGSWGDYDNDGDLDLFLGNRDLEEIIPNMLFQNNGDGTFTDVNIVSGIGNVNALTFQGTFFDYDNDGWLDIYLINDRLGTENILYHNNSDGTFTDVSEMSGANFTMNAMSIGLDDYNADGYIDMYITNTYNPELPVVGNALIKNNGDGTFAEIAITSGTSFDSTSWGASWVDGDNDGRLDLYVSGSNDNNGGENVSAAYYYQNEDETFTRIVENGFETDLAYSFGNATGDYNNDGYSDIVVSNNAPYTFDLWQNRCQEVDANNWLKITLEGVESNRDGYGSRIEISINGVKQYRVTASVESYLSQHSDSEIFGVGETSVIDYVKVTWLSGQIDFLEDVLVNQTLNILEGQASLSIKDNDDSFNFLMSPNPSSGYVCLKLPRLLGEINIIKTYDALGQLVLEQSISKTDEQLIITNLNKGIYFVSYYSDGNLIETKRLIKK